MDDYKYLVQKLDPVFNVEPQIENAENAISIWQSLGPFNYKRVLDDNTDFEEDLGRDMIQMYKEQTIVIDAKNL